MKNKSKVRKRSNKRNKKRMPSYSILLIILGIITIAGDTFYRLHAQNVANKKSEDLASFLMIQDVEAEISNNESQPKPKKEVETPDTNLYGIVRIKDIEVNQAFMLGGNFNRLYEGAVAFKDSTLPGEGGNFSIAGHRGTCAQCDFNNLKNAQKGSELEILTPEGNFVYEITENVIIDVHDTYVVDDKEGDNIVTLITCVTNGKNPRRRMVRGTLVKEIRAD